MNTTSKIATTVSHMETHLGGRKKHGNFTQQALFLHAALALCRDADGAPTATFTLDREEHIEKWGFKTIYQAIAGEYHHLILLNGANESYNPKATYSQMTHNASTYEHIYRQGLLSLNNILAAEWDGVRIYAVPRIATAGGLIEVITLNPDFVVNGSGQTAAEVQEKRVKLQAEGILTAKAKTLTKTAGHEKAMQILAEVTDAINDYVPPRGFREDEFGQGLLPY